MPNRRRRSTPSHAALQHCGIAAALEKENFAMDAQRPTEMTQPVTDLIVLIKNLIENYVKFYLTPKQIFTTIEKEHRIPSHVTKEVWRRMEGENCQFFAAYHKRLMLIKQIMIFNQLLINQRNLLEARINMDLGISSRINSLSMQASPLLVAAENYEICGNLNQSFYDSMFQVPLEQGNYCNNQILHSNSPLNGFHFYHMNNAVLAPSSTFSNVPFFPGLANVHPTILAPEYPMQRNDDLFSEVITGTGIFASLQYLGSDMQINNIPNSNVGVAGEQMNRYT